MNEAALQEILSEFDAPELFYIEHRNAGPDEELYFFEGQEGNKYGLWVRDYMSELAYEAEGLKNDFDIDVEKWLKLRAGDEYVTEFNGDYYALFAML